MATSESDDPFNPFGVPSSNHSFILTCSLGEFCPFSICHFRRIRMCILTSEFIHQRETLHRRSEYSPHLFTTEANSSLAVATVVGIIFGPVALNLFNPFTWGNTDQITLELSRIVLIVQVFAVGVELPKAYMWRHWRSLFFLLVPVMTFGWIVSSAFIYWLIPALNFV